MAQHSRIKPVSYLKANAAEILNEVAEQRATYVITQNGEAKAVLQDIASYEVTQETLALLKLLALGRADSDAGRVRPAIDVIEELRRKLGAD